MKQELKNYLKLSFIYFTTTISVIFFRFPDIKNEMKYFIITNNMIDTKNWFILKYFNDLYPDKPPFYFWILSLNKILFKNYYFFNLLIGSTIFGFIILIFSYSLIKKLSTSSKAFNLSISLSIFPFFIGTSVIQRMDMMMSSFIFLTLYFFFNFYYNLIKISFFNLTFFYFFIFMGIFSKGIFAIAFPLFSIIFFLFLEKNLIFLKKLKIFYGLFILVLLISLWFYNILISENGVKYIKFLLGQETIGRIIKSKNHIRPFYFYIKSIPYILYPYGFIFLSLLIVYLKNIYCWKNWNKLEKIGFSCSFIPIIILSLASGKLEIYLTPLLPFIIIFIFSNLEKNLNNKFINIIFKLTEITLILPIIFKLFFKNINYFKRIVFINTSIFIFIFILIFNLNFYNNNYSLKAFINFINNHKISSYKFSNAKNLSFLVKNEIINYNFINEIDKDCQYILIENKNLKYFNKNFSIILKNKKYSLLKI